METMGSTIRDRELSRADLNENFFDGMEDDSNRDSAANFIFEYLFEDVLMGTLFDFHHGVKTGLTELLEGEPEDQEATTIVESPDCDVFGVPLSKKPPDTNCYCPNCERAVSASRFAPHLEKCMGMGRNSSRKASRRIASNSREPASYAGMLSDDEDDSDWAGGSTAAVSHDRRRKKSRNNGSKKSASKFQNGSGKTNGMNSEVNSCQQDSGGATYETMTPNERKNLLMHICGVVSEHTGKLCTRSTRCPQHTEEQRRQLRTSVLEPPPVNTLGIMPTVDTASIGSENGSPPDSSPSSSCSSSSRKRDRHRPSGKSKCRRLPSP